jgi:integrase
MGVYARGSKLWLRYRDAEGKWRDRSSGCAVGQEAMAQAMYEELVRRFAPAAAESTPALVGPLTVRGYAVTWLRERREQGIDWKVDASRLKLHVLPFIGDMALAEVRTRHLIAMFHTLRTDRERDLAPRTVHHVYATVGALFRDARLAGHIEQTPADLDERQLGPVKDRDPEWRATAVLARDEVEQIISDPRIPPDRQMVYGLELLAGVRPGEAAALRFRHYDPTIRPLGRLLVARSYNTRRNAEKGTKTDVTKHVPVHPVLAAMLGEWKLGGWAAMMGRAPGPDDLIVPLPPEHAARRRTRGGEAFRPNVYSGKRWTEDDLPALGWRHRRHYDMRATFITLAIADGADPEILETRVTHTKRSQSAFDGYHRPDLGPVWERTCSEVAKLRIVRGPREPAAAAAAATPGGFAASTLQGAASLQNSSHLFQRPSVSATDSLGTSEW